MTMRRILALLIVFALAFTNSAAVATAMCQHQDGAAHALARTSDDHRIAAEAHSEDLAESTTSRKGSLGDTAAGSFASYALPAEPPVFPMLLAEKARRGLGRTAELAGRSVRPLLDPPLA